MSLAPQRPGGDTSVPLLEVEDIVVKYGEAVALDGVSLVLEPGERVALIGPNGAGKTSLLSAVSGVVRPASGTIRVDGVETTRFSPGKVVRLGVSMVPEGRQVFPSLTVEQNLLMGAFGRVAGREPFGALVRYALARAEIAARLEHVYDLLPKLRELRDRAAGRTSGGEQQMVAIGRALMADPRLLAVDELSLGLAPIVVQGLVTFLRELNEERGVALLLVEQNAFIAFDLCPRAYVLEAGQIRLEGPSGELERNPVVRDAYLGGGLEVA
jgi:branched-chain amino acid transport system ATP-binding protein